MTVSLVARAADRPSSHRPSTAWVARALRAQGMPRDEVRALLSADDAQVVHRFVELHEERLQEQLATRIRTIRDIERSLTAPRRRW